MIGECEHCKGRGRIRLVHDGETLDVVDCSRCEGRGRRLLWRFLGQKPSLGERWVINGMKPSTRNRLGLAAHRTLFSALEVDTWGRDDFGPWACRLDATGEVDVAGDVFACGGWEWVSAFDATGVLGDEARTWAALAATQFGKGSRPAEVLTAAMRMRGRWENGELTDSQAWSNYLDVQDRIRREGWADWLELAGAILMPAPIWEAAKYIASDAARILVRFELGYQGERPDRREFIGRMVDGEPRCVEAFRGVAGWWEESLQLHIEAAMQDARAPSVMTGPLAVMAGPPKACDGTSLRGCVVTVTDERGERWPR